LKALGITLVAGRDISERDTPSGEPVIVINQTMARTLWPGQKAIGQTMRACGERHVVGVVGDVRHLALEQASGMEMYLPMRQCTDISSLDSERCSNWWIKPSRPDASWCCCMD
jgi:hypothetical protein